jgi:hypothetical protein
MSDNGALEVAKAIWSRDHENVQVSRMHLSSWDNSISVVWHPGPGFGKELMFWRTRTASDARAKVMKRLPAILQYAATRTNLPSQRFIQVDWTDDNPLGCPYIVMSEQPLGHRLNNEHMNTPGRAGSVAEGIGSLLGGLLRPEVECLQAGLLWHKTAPAHGDANSTFELRPNCVEETVALPNLLKTDFSDCGPDAVYQWLKQCFTRQIANIEACEGPLEAAHAATPALAEEIKQSRLEVVNRLLIMAGELSEAGWLMDCKFTLVNLEMTSPTPHTVVIDPTEDDPDHIKFTGFAPGPAACLAPSFLICRPPVWMWGTPMGPDPLYEPVKYILEQKDLDGPRKVVKARFDKAAGPKYQMFAYHPIYRVARCMAWYAILGIGMTADPTALANGIRRANATLKSWECLKSIKFNRGAPLNVQRSMLMDGLEIDEEDRDKVMFG